MNQCFFFQKFQLYLVLFLFGLIPPLTASADTISQIPLFLGSGSSTPLVMLVMGRDHKLYYEAYNDASDLNGDGVLDTTYKPDTIDYFGLFNSFLCYEYKSDLDKFTPVAKATGTNKKQCSNKWSGDFLNYLTTSRMDALRKVLYGGYRIPKDDTDSGTILERSYIPQDAHSWGKEYYSVAHDGYDISQYAPLTLPMEGTRHLFANTSLWTDISKPLLRVLNDSSFRIWQWVSKETPVAGSACIGGNCQTDGGTDNSHPTDAAEFAALLTKFANSGHLMGTSSSASPAPSFALNGKIQCTSGGCNPYGSDDYYITVFRGILNVTVPGTYEFSVDGDDAVEVIIKGTTIGWYTGHGICNASPANTVCRDAHKGSVTLEVGAYPIEFHHEEVSGGDSYLLFWKVPSATDWQVVPNTSFSDLVISTYSRTVKASAITDHTVRVDACVANFREENNPDASEYCRGYPAGSPTVYKPAGLLQQYSEDEPERMAFGLITGSYRKNTSGGVLRKNIGPFSVSGDTDNKFNEVDRSTGVFNVDTKGIVNTLDQLKIVGFNNFRYDCGLLTTRAIKEGECVDWGNPIGEMMYESLRYFAGQPSKAAPAPTSSYVYSNASDGLDANPLALPKPVWTYPFRAKTDMDKIGVYSGAKCFMMALSDINPSFDTDQIPGKAFPNPASPATSISSTLPNLNVADLASTIWASEEKSNPAFIGESLSNTPAFDGAPTAKTVTSLGNIRGLSPEEPTKQGGFYSSSVAFFGNTYGISGDLAKKGTQRVETLSVALASPLPRIEVPFGTGSNKRYITLVPFAKSVGNNSIDTDGKFQPTNQIVDFYVLKIANTGPGNQDDDINEGRPYGKFSINYEDVEQGNDHDMDVIVEYEFWALKEGTQDVLKVELNSVYAAGSITQHMGYVISGTDGLDGVYLDVADTDTGETSDFDYRLDTPIATTTDFNPTSPTYQHTLPKAEWPTDYWIRGNGQRLPLKSTRIFKPGSTTAASFIKHDPLWYAAKWGGFNDLDEDGLPDSGEWDSEVKGKPDNYYLVTNAGLLKKQLGEAFAAIQSKTGTATVTAVNAGKAFGDDDIFQAGYNSEDWSGTLLSLRPSFTATGQYKELQNWDAGKKINDWLPNSRTILTYKPTKRKGVNFVWPKDPESPSDTELDLQQVKDLSAPPTDGVYDYALGKLRLEFLRGDNSNEGNTSGKFRKRSSDLGDIVNSSPIYVGAPSTRYSDTMESEKYSDFRKKVRSAIIYVGANDGMLHGFDTNGIEQVAYVPSPVYPNLRLLTQQDYKTQGDGDALHHFYVDGGLHVGDAFFDSDWHSVLIGRLGAGGQGVFALNVSDPDVFDTDTETVLWEFTDTDDVDLGYTFGRSWIAKTNTTAGTWVAIFGNGYNSNEQSNELDNRIGTGHGVLYIVDVKNGPQNTGDVIKIEATDPNAKDTDGNVVISQGLSSPYLYDVNDDNKVDWIYAGDMKGNLWKFDVSDPSTANWKAKLLFTARATDTDGKPLTGADGKPLTQPITTMPITLNHPKGGVLVLFGTGRFLFNGDSDNTDVQSYYAIWDQESWGADLKPGTNDSGEVGFVAVGRGADGKEDTKPRGSLLKQTFNVSVTFEGQTYRTSSDNTICWLEDGCTIGDEDVDQQFGWYIDLPFAGERVIYEPRLDKGRVIFGSNATTSKDPNATVDPCDSKATEDKSWLNILDAVSGSRLSTSFLKRKTDKEVEPILVPGPDDVDIAPSSIESDGRKPGPSELLVTEESKVALQPGGGGEISKGEGRQSWRQITQ